MSRRAASSRWSGGSTAWLPRTPATRTTWSIAPAALPSGTASPRRANASSWSPACRSERPARPTWCASPSWARKPPKASDLLRVPAWDPRGKRVDLTHHRIGRDVLRHVADAGKNDEPRIRNGGRDGLRMDARRNNGVGVAGNDDGRGRDVAIMRRFGRDEGFEPGDVFGIGD